MTTLIHVGTSGWAYPAWKPDFYPQKLPQNRFLQHYANRLNAVEVNYSFRHRIAEKTLANWIAETPAAFAFCIKAHQAITHIRRLKNTDDILRRFLDSIQPLAAADKLGPVLFQLPPNMKADTALLDAFLAQLPQALRPAFEFRHVTWFSESVGETLRRHNAALCVAESDHLTVPDAVTADFSYFRFRRSDYSAGARRQIAARLERCAAAGRHVFAFMKHQERPESALWAEEILRAAQAQVAAD
jgi:uncharacterized protein YecE (DUF72 family)